MRRPHSTNTPRNVKPVRGGHKGAPHRVEKTEPAEPLEVPFKVPIKEPFRGSLKGGEDPLASASTTARTEGPGQAFHLQAVREKTFR